MILDLTMGLGDHPEYKLFKFPGGELHFKAKFDLKEPFLIKTRLNTAEDIISLALITETLHKDGATKIDVYIPYMPYAQADRDFSVGESFSLKTITKILNNLPVNQYTIYDAHSDVTPALLKNCRVLDNQSLISWVLYNQLAWDRTKTNLIWLSPDAGAYKKIFKLAENVGFNGQILCCQKDRNTSNGAVTVVVPPVPENTDILIIDDICVGGRTFTEISKAIPRAGNKLYLAVSHGIFSNGLSELSHHFTKVFSTNSRFDDYYSNAFDKYPPDFLLQFKII